MKEKTYGFAGAFAALFVFLGLALPGVAWAGTGLVAAEPDAVYSVGVEVSGGGEAQVSVAVNGAEQPDGSAVAAEGDTVSVSVTLGDPKARAVKSFAVARPDGTAVERERADVEVGRTNPDPYSLKYQYAHVYTFSMPASDVTARCELDEACMLLARCTNRMDNSLVLVDNESGDVVEATGVSDPPPAPYTSCLMSSGTCLRIYYVAAGEYGYRLYNAGELYESGTVAVGPGKSALLEWLPANVVINGVEVEDVGYVGTGECYYTAKGGQEIHPVFESSDDYGNYNAYFVLKATEKGADYTFHVLSDKEGCSFRSYTASPELTVFANGYIPQQSGWWQVATNEYRVTVPEGARLRAYRHPSVAYKEWVEIEPTSTVTAGGKTTYRYNAVSGHLELVAGGVGTGFAKTYWNKEFREEDESVEMEVPIIDATDHQARDELDGLYLNVVDEGYCQSMNVGDEFVLEGFRVFQPTLSATTNRYVEPDMRYEVIAGDSVSISDIQGGEGRRYVTVKAEGPGVSIVKVTYGELYTIGPNGRVKMRHGAIAPEQVGIVAFDVGGDDSSIDPGIGLRKYDTVYFANSITQPDGTVVQGKGHGEYTFAPSVAGGGGVTVETHKPYQLESSYAESTWEACAPNGDGSFTVPLYTGRNIVRISSGDAVRHFVINAMATDVVVSNKTKPGQALRAGDEASVSFSGLELPVQKMTAIYNPGWYDPSGQWGMSSDSGTYLVGTLEGPSGPAILCGERTQYDIRNVSEFLFTVLEAGDYELSGAQIHCTHMGSALDAHCSIPLSGLPPNLNASSNDARADYCVLPDVQIFVMPSGADGAAAEASRLIGALPAANALSVADAPAVAAARAAYDALSADAKAAFPEEDVLALALAEAVIEKLALQEEVETLGKDGAGQSGKLADADTKAKAAEDKLAKAKAARKANTAKVSAKAKTLKAKKLKKKAQTFKAITVKKAKGKVIYKKVKVSKRKFAKKFAVDKKTGKIIVKKGVKKGVYKVTVKVKAAGNKAYRATAKSVVVRITVK